MKIKNSVKIAFIIAIVGIVWMLSGLLKGDDDNQVDIKPSEDKVVKLMSVRTKFLDASPRTREISVLGVFKASRQATIRAETTGLIEEILAEEGNEIKANDLIVRIAIKNREKKLEEARALLKQREIEFQANQKLTQKGFRARTKLAESQANLEAARAALRAIELDIGKTKVKAPFTGVLNKREVELGDFVDIGDVIAKIVDFDPIIIEAQITEKDVHLLQMGASGYVTFSDGEQIQGKISYIGSIANENTRTFPIELTIENINKKLSEGITAELFLPVRTEEAHFVNPSVLVLSDSGEIGVKIVDGENKVQFIPVRILEDTPQGIWLGNLPTQINIITVGQEFVVPGQVVNPVPQK